MKPAYSKIIEEYHALSEKLISATPDQIAKLGKQQADLLPVFEKAQELQRLEKELNENQKLAEGQD